LKEAERLAQIRRQKLARQLASREQLEEQLKPVDQQNVVDYESELD